MKRRRNKYGRYVTKHPDGYLVRAMRNGRVYGAIVAGHSAKSLRVARLAGRYLEAVLPPAAPGRRTDLTKRAKGA